MLRSILILLFLSLTINVHGQDRIFTTSSDTIEGKILEIRNDTLFLKLYINKHNVYSHIKMANVKHYSYGISNKLKSGIIYKFLMNDESIVYGSVKAIDKDSIFVLSSFSNGFNIYKGAIVDHIVQEVEFIQNSTDSAVVSPVVTSETLKQRTSATLWVKNPHYTRYFFAPSAYSIAKGTGYYQNVYVLLNSVNYGLTDHFSIGGGIEFISTFTGEPTVFLTPKFGIELTDKFDVGGGVIAGILIGEEVAGIGYVNSTYGTHESNITFGLGWGYLVEDFYKEPIININAMTRIHKRFSLITENWIIPQYRYSYDPPNYDRVKTGMYYDPYFSYGFRYFKDKISIDFAFVNSPDIFDFIFIGIPYIDFVLLF